MKNITIAGNIGKDAEVRRTQSGDAVANFSVAVEHREGQNKSTIWFDVSLWGKRGESLAQYLRKGGNVAVSGELGAREYNGKTYLSVRANEVTLLGGKPEGGSQNGGGNDRAPARQNDMDDEIPF